MADYNFLLTTRLSQDQQTALQMLQDICRARGLNVYVTGGSMRDLLTGHTIRLLSFTTEGDPLRLEAPLAAAGAERLSGRAESATLSLSLRGCRVRLEAARDAAGKTGASIHQDLMRRGLTLNSIALSLNAGSRGLPLDPTNGAGDIEARLIRMNHSYVFLEDPIAALRAVRLRTRLGFAIEERTGARMQAALEEGYLGRASAAARGQEWEAIAYEPDPAAVLSALEREHWLAAAFGSGVRTSKMNLAALGRLTATVEAWELLGMTPDVGLVAMPLMVAGLAPADQTRLTQGLPSRHLANGWKKLVAEAHALEKQLAAGNGGSGWLHAAQEILDRHTVEAVIYATINPSQTKANRKLRDFHAAALEQRRKLPLGTLRAAGVAPHSLEAERILGPWYRRLLAGEALSEAEVNEGIRAAIAGTQSKRAVEPKAAATPPEHTAAKAARKAKAEPVRAARSKAARTKAPAGRGKPARGSVSKKKK